MEPSAASSKPPRRRRIWQFGLGTTFVVVTLMAVWLAIVAARHRERMATIAELKSRGVTLSTEPTGPIWLRNLLGEDYCSKVVAAEIAVTQLEDETIRVGDMSGDVRQAVATVARLRNRLASFDVPDDQVTVRLTVDRGVYYPAVVELLEGLSSEAVIGRFSLHDAAPSAPSDP